MGNSIYLGNRGTLPKGYLRAQSPTLLFNLYLTRSGANRYCTFSQNSRNNFRWFLTTWRRHFQVKTCIKYVYIIIILRTLVTSLRDQPSCDHVMTSWLSLGCATVKAKLHSRNGIKNESGKTAKFIRWRYINDVIILFYDVIDMTHLCTYLTVLAWVRFANLISVLNKIVVLRKN